LEWLSVHQRQFAFSQKSQVRGHFNLRRPSPETDTETVRTPDSATTCQSEKWQALSTSLLTGHLITIGRAAFRLCSEQKLAVMSHTRASAKFLKRGTEFCAMDLTQSVRDIRTP
jgi:hypothetical protein